MRYRLLGRTGLLVSELCLGTMTFGAKGRWAAAGGLGQREVNVLMREAFESGVNFIDTANVYGLGEAEKLVGEAIRRLGLPRDELVISTKASGAMHESAVNERGHSRHHLLRQVDASLARLGVDHIDLFQLHGTDPLTPLDEVLCTLNDLVRCGKVRTVGLCNMAAWQVMKALSISGQRDWARCESVQAYYTIAGRDAERELVPLVADQQLGLMVWSPLAGGLLSGKFLDDQPAPAGTRRATVDFPIVDKPRAARCVEAMRPVAERHGVSVARIALAWLLARPEVTSVIVGARTSTQLQDNLGATRVLLDVGELEMLDAVSDLPPEYPGWMLERQSQGRRAPG